MDNHKLPPPRRLKRPNYAAAITSPLPPPTRSLKRIRPLYLYPFMDANEVLIRAVWNKGIAIDGYDPDRIRRDTMGSVIVFSAHGKCTEFGWEIDHIIPRAASGTSDLINLQPLQWQNNRRKSDSIVPTRPMWWEYLHGR